MDETRRNPWPVYQQLRDAAPVLRALISRAFTPRMISGLEPRVRRLSRELLAKTEGLTEIDLASEYSVPLAMQVIGGMISRRSPPG